MKRLPPNRRFWTKVDVSTGCWVWNGTMTHDGYGRFMVKRKNWIAHRYAYEMMVGPIPSGLTIDHLCRNRRCVNPEHLEPATIRENVLRGDDWWRVGIGAAKSAKTHCPSGHEYAGENLVIDGSSGARRCRACERAKVSRYRKRLVSA